MEKARYIKVLNILLFYRNEIVIGLFLGAILSVIIFNFDKLIYLSLNLSEIKDIANNFNDGGVLLFTIYLAIQVIVFIIPGEIAQLAAGYIYGVFWGSVISLVGLSLGSGIIFYMARILGKNYIHRMINRKKYKYLCSFLERGNLSEREFSKRVNLIVFLIYLIPGLPKDILGYVCGIIEMPFHNYICFSTLGRLPGIIVSSAVGAGVYKGNKLLFLLIALSIFTIFTLLKGENLIKRFGKKLVN